VRTSQAKKEPVPQKTLKPTKATNGDKLQDSKSAKTTADNSTKRTSKQSS